MKTKLSTRRATFYKLISAFSKETPQRLTEILVQFPPPYTTRLYYLAALRVLICLDHSTGLPYQPRKKLVKARIAQLRAVA